MQQATDRRILPSNNKKDISDDAEFKTVSRLFVTTRDEFLPLTTGTSRLYVTTSMENLTTWNMELNIGMKSQHVLNKGMVERIYKERKSQSTF